VKVWDTTTGKETLILTGNTAGWSPDSKRIVVTNVNFTMTVWDTTTGREGVTLKGHRNPIISVAWSPDSKQIASGSYDNTVKVWDATTGKESLTLEGHAQQVNSVAWSPDGKRLVSGSNDLTVKVWKVAGRQPPTTPVTKPIGKKTDGRLPVPDAAALDAAEKEVKEAYKADYAKPGPTDVVNLYTRLGIEGSNASDKPAAFRYVLLREARDLAAKAGNYGQTMTAVEDMARIFAEDVWEMKADALEKVDAKAGIEMNRRFGRENTTKPYHRDFASFALIAADEAIEDDAFRAAERFVRVAEANAAAAGEARLKALVPERLKELAALRKAYEPVLDARNALAARPGDPDANLVVGKFYCLAKGDWDRGLPRLAGSSDGKLKDLAKSDMECPPETDAMGGLADQYAAQAEKEEGDAKTHLRWRACYWYERAEGTSTDPSRAKVFSTKRAAIEKNLAPARAFVLYSGFGPPTSWTIPTSNLRRLLLVSESQKLTFPKGIHSALELADTPPGQPCTLFIVYRHRGRVRLSITKDSETVNLVPQAGFVDTQPGRPAPGQHLTILYARYGTGGRYADVTAKVQSAVKDNTLDGKPSDLGLDDPAPGKPKRLAVVFAHGDRVFFRVTDDNNPIIFDASVAER
jgi:WD40 repeat protein